MTSRQLVLRTLIVFSSLHGVVGVAANEEPVSVKEGHSVTLYTDANEHKPIVTQWYFDSFRIARISEHLIKICTDAQCPESFRDRLTVDSLAGHLTITNIRSEHAGVYLLQISGHIRSETSFNVTVQDVPAAERDEVTKICVIEGEPVTLDPAVFKNPNDSLTWHFNDTHIAKIAGDQSQICTDVQCEERFRDRLKLDHQTGSLTVTNTRTADSGEYTVKIIVRIRRCHSITSVERFRVAVVGSDPSVVAVAGIYVTVVLLVSAAVAGLIYYHHRRSRNEEERRSGCSNGTQHQDLLT